MSGRKQHYIPQVLLRGFEVKKTKKNGRKKKSTVSVTVYTRDRGVFASPTRDVGAERYFYSELDVQSKTLDDKITDYEAGMGSVINRLRQFADRQTVHAEEAAELVTHLTIRNNHFRRSITASAVRIADGLIDGLTDCQTALRVFGLDGQEPTGQLAEEISKMWERYKPVAHKSGLTEADFRNLVMTVGRLQVEHRKEDNLRLWRQLYRKDVIGKAATGGHNRALMIDLAPPRRVELIKHLHWRIIHTDYDLILPDCVAVGFGADDSISPLAISEDMDRVRGIAMPLSSGHLLVAGDENPSADIVEKLVECSWDFFVGNERRDDLVSLVRRIRMGIETRLERLCEEAVDDALGRRP